MMVESNMSRWKRRTEQRPLLSVFRFIPSLSRGSVKDARCCLKIGRFELWTLYYKKM